MKALFLITFWIGVGLLILGHGVSFYPGVEARWFATSAILCASGFFIRSKIYRIATIFLVGISVTYGIWGYQRGKEYRDWLSNQPSPQETRQEIREHPDETKAEQDSDGNAVKPLGDERSP